MTSVDEALSYTEDAIGIGRKGTIDKPYRLNAPFWTVDTLFYSIPHKDVDIEFALGSFLNVDWKCKDESTGLPSLSKEAINETPVMVPAANEQETIGRYLSNLDHLITLHQSKPSKSGKSDLHAWEQRKFGELYRLVSEKNDLSFGRDKIISVANMYFNTAVYVTDDAYLATYNVMRLGDIAFEGHSSKEFSHGRFVENYIGDGIVSHIFSVFRPREPFDINYWRYAINNEKLMRSPLIKSTKASTMMHDLVPSDLLQETIPTPSLSEQKEIGAFLVGLDSLITLHQCEYICAQRCFAFKKNAIKAEKTPCR